jgi:NitT/TauT family transport system permease protein
MATALGFAIGSSVAFVLAMILGYSSYLRRVFSVYIVMLQSVPKVAFAPVFIAWFGFGLVSKIVMSAVICFFPVFVDTLTGLGLTERKAINLMRSLKATRTEILFKLRLPTALPNVFAGLKTGVTLALIGVIVAELVGTNLGLGFLIGLYSFQLQVDNVFAIIVILGLIGWGMYAIVDFINRRVVFWHRDSHEDFGEGY